MLSRELKIQLEQRRQTMLQLHPSDQQLYCLLGCDLYKRFGGKNKRKTEWKSRLTEIAGNEQMNSL